MLSVIALSTHVLTHAKPLTESDWTILWVVIMIGWIGVMFFGPPGSDEEETDSNQQIGDYEI